MNQASQDSMKKTYLIFFLFFGLLSSAQTNPPAPAPQPSAAPTPQQPPSAQSPEKPSLAPKHIDTEDPTKEGTPKAHKITPIEAKELFQSVDEILRFAGTDTLLPVKHDVKKAIVSREQVEKYIGDKMKDDADRIRFERSELVLKKFGLLPRKFDLHNFLIKLFSEQVAGYYDEKSKTMNLLDWIDPEMQRPVMAHELTHALQDQSFDLGKMTKHDEEIEKRGLEDLDAMIQNDEESTCRSAVLEGQAMIVLLDYILAPAGRNAETSPQVVDMMASSMAKSDGSPVFDSAPLLLQEELTFPYKQGMIFIKELLVAGGKKLAYTGVLSRMPQTTREVLEPAEYLAGHREPPLLLPDFAFLKKGFEPFDAGAVGELDVNILLKMYTEEAVANRLSREWRGGSYYAAGRKKAKPEDGNSTGHIGLFYVSKWSTDAAAQEFAKVYGSALAKRYTGLQPVAADPAHPGLDKYSSADGLILIQQTGNTVVATESFDQDVAQKLIEAGLKQTGQSGK
jgi:hypothetical protein